MVGIQIAKSTWKSTELLSLVINSVCEPRMSNCGYEMEGLNFRKHSTSQVHVSRRDAEVMAILKNTHQKCRIMPWGKKRKRTDTFCHVNGEVLCSKQQVRESFGRIRELCIY